MNIGIVVYSQTGHTLEAANRLREKLETAGHRATVERIVPLNENEKNPRIIHYGQLPDVLAYDALVLAAPVQAFTLCAAMAAYLVLLPELGGKKVACLVTKGFSSAWTGGNRAVSLIRTVVEERGGTVCGAGIIGWGAKKREQRIAKALEEIAGLF